MTTMNPIGWTHKDEWRKPGKGFLVTITRHSEPLREGSDEGPHRWAVYAYVYPSHPNFAKFEGPNMWQDAAVAMPLHSYPSLLRWHRDDDGKPLSVQVGADYHHLHDDHFTHYDTPALAHQVFADAAQLHAWLTKAGEPT